MQRQVIDPLFERNNPAVQKVAGTDELPPEIVDNKNSAYRLYLKRRFVIFGDWVEVQVEHFQSEFTAGYNNRPAATNPARIKFFLTKRKHGRFLTRLCRRPNYPVHGGVKNLDNLAVDLDAVGNVDRMLKTCPDTLGDTRLAVSAPAVNQDRPAGVDSRSQAARDVIGQDQMREALGKHGRIDSFVHRGLLLDL